MESFPRAWLLDYWLCSVIYSFAARAGGQVESVAVEWSGRGWFCRPSFPLQPDVIVDAAAAMHRICPASCWSRRKVFIHLIPSNSASITDVFTVYRVVLDRVWTPLDGGWSSLNGCPSRCVLADDLKDEIRTSWKHFRPTTPPPVEEDDPPTTSDAQAAATADRGVDRVSIYADGDEDQYQTYDTETIDQLYADRHLERWAAAAAAACSPTPVPPDDCGSSNFHVVGDILPDASDTLDWWNYLDVNGGVGMTFQDDQLDLLASETEAMEQDSSRTSPPHPPPASSVTTTTTSTPLPAAASTPPLHGKSKNSVGPALAMNGVANSPATVDSPFWMTVPKGAASLPNSDWYWLATLSIFSSFLQVIYS